MVWLQKAVFIQTAQNDIPYSTYYVHNFQEERELKKDEEKEEKKSKGDKRNTVSAKKTENGSSKIPAPKKGII